MFSLLRQLPALIPFHGLIRFIHYMRTPQLGMQLSHIVHYTISTIPRQCKAPRDQAACAILSYLIIRTTSCQVQVLHLYLRNNCSLHSLSRLHSLSNHISHPYSRRMLFNLLSRYSPKECLKSSKVDFHHVSPIPLVLL